MHFVKTLTTTVPVNVNVMFIADQQITAAERACQLLINLGTSNTLIFLKYGHNSQESSNPDLSMNNFNLTKQYIFFSFFFFCELPANNVHVWLLIMSVTRGPIFSANTNKGKGLDNHHSKQENIPVFILFSFSCELKNGLH